MNIKTSLFNSTTNDLTIVIDLLRASTTITTALDNFNKVIPVNNDEIAFKIKNENDDVILAGEKDLKTISGYDMTNSPCLIKEKSGNIFVINTTNGTKVLENIKNRDPNIKVLVGTSINAHAVAKKALDLANNEIELIMAGRHGEFNIEDAVGAGLIINEIIKEANKNDIDIKLDETALITKIIAEDTKKTKELIDNSKAANRLSKLGLKDDVLMCEELNTIEIVGLYENGEITKV